MPITTQQAEWANYWWHWQDWPVPIMPNVPAAAEPWGWDDKAFWRQPVTGRAVDAQRTAALKSVDVPVGAHAGAPPWAGSSYGMPYHVFEKENRPKNVTPILDTSVPSYGPWRWQPNFPFIGRDVRYAVDWAPLPDVTRREGDPGVSSDSHAYLLDPPMSALWELYQLQRPGWTPAQGVEWTSSHSGGGRGVCRWDTSRDWRAAGQPRGVVATDVPQFPMIGRFDQALAAIGTGAGLGHALFFTLPNYNSRFEGAARKSDGSSASHPVYGGTLLRLRREIMLGVPENSAARIVAETLATHGGFQGDRTTWGKADTDGVGGCTLTMDRRWHEGAPEIKGFRDVPMHTVVDGVGRPLLLTDFEVVAQ